MITHKTDFECINELGFDAFHPVQVDNLLAVGPEEGVRIEPLLQVLQRAWNKGPVGVEVDLGVAAVDLEQAYFG